MSDVQQDLTSLSPEQVRDLALALAKKDERDRHWTRLAQIIGYVEAARLYESRTFGGHLTLRAWALNDLNLGSADVGLLRRLFTMLQTFQGDIPLSTWRDIGKGKAEVLLRVAKMGADADQMRKWLGAAALNSTTALEEAYKELIGEDVWVEWSVSVPKDVALLLDRALETFLSEVMDQPSPDPKLIHDPATRHLLAEHMANDVLQRDRGDA